MLNLNVGILGHVDSGKTSLAKVLSHVASTAAFDKNPQSQERGITLDLGFSSFSIPMPDHLKLLTNSDVLQFTLVDCPGHASLIKTIIGGAQIIDFMILVIDAVKGIQTQTAECIVIGELTCDKMMVVLNKIDMIDEAKRTTALEKIKKKIYSTLQQTKFKNAPIVDVAVQPSANVNLKPIGLDKLIETLSNFSFVPSRNKDEPFLFAVDHCFGIKGQGTVMTGTVLQGKVAINDIIEVPHLQITRKVKSLQMFKRPIQTAIQGDRLGICVTQFDSSKMERSIISSPKLLSLAYCCLIQMNRIKYFKSKIKSKSNFHITIGHDTVMATITLFSSYESQTFIFANEYQYEEEFEQEEPEKLKYYFALLEFKHPVYVLSKTLLIGSKLDMDIHGNACRLAFWGNLLEFSDNKDYKAEFFPNLKIFKTKKKVGVIDRFINQKEIIVKNLFNKNSNVSNFLGLNIMLSTGELGKIESIFGQSTNGKVKVTFPDDLKEDTCLRLSKNKGRIVETEKNINVLLEFKKYIFDSTNKIIQ